MKEFVLSDESLNCYGLVVMTSGIDLTAFKKNPIMLLGHDRSKGVIGRWEGLRVENGKLLGTPIFDDQHEPGKTVKEQVESGFLRAASLGLEIIELEEEYNGVKTVTRSKVVEVSIVDIPANENALQLYYNDMKVDSLSMYLQLSNKQPIMNEQDFKQVLDALGLPSDAQTENILKVIEDLKAAVSGEKDVNEALAMAINEGIISNSEKKFFEAAFRNSPIELASFLKERREERYKQLSKDYDTYMAANRYKFNFSSDFIEGTLKRLAMKDFEAFKEMGERMPKPVKPSDILKLGKRTETDNTGISNKAKSEWTLEDYRKYAPQELRRNPQLYSDLLDKEL